MSPNEAICHIEAYICGGYELGLVSLADVSQALDVIEQELQRLWAQESAQKALTESIDHHYEKVNATCQ